MVRLLSMTRLKKLMNLQHNWVNIIIVFPQLWQKSHLNIDMFAGYNRPLLDLL